VRVQLNARRLVLWLALSSVLASSIALADELTGAVSGAVMLRHNYYLERSTRVVAPEVGARLDFPSGTTVEATYLVDAITSASLAAGAIEDVAFTEIRHDVSATLGHRFEIEGNPAILAATLRRSHEPDYDSLAVNLFANAELNQRNTTVTFRLSFLADEVRQNFRGRDNTPTTMGFQEELNGVGAALGITQILSKTAFVGADYEFFVLDGFTANAYRRVLVAGTPLPEYHPETRRRHTLAGRLAVMFPEIGTALHLHARLYRDDWDILAATPEARLYKRLGSSTLRLRYRYYRQGSAFFYRANGEYELGDPYLTADPKMAPFHSHLLGTQLKIFFDFLEDSPLKRFRTAALDIGFEYLFSTSAFGNGAIVQAGLIIPF
jgi:hypothetical protein